MDRLLVIDDDPLVRAHLSSTLADPRRAIAAAKTGLEGLASFRNERPDVVLLDIHLPDRSGLELFRELQAIDGTVPIIFITASTDSARVIEAIKLGSYDYVVKPIDLARVKDLVERGVRMRRMMSVPVAVGASSDPGADALIGVCPAMQEVYKAIGRVAPYDVNVLISGESGTGKELVARAIYQHSRRSGHTFLAINCAAIPGSLLESELFGHEKGAFTGADRQHIGKFEQCNGGTLFLDEIGDMPLPLQSKILRVLQEKQFQRVGGRQTLTTDVRVLAATHRDLERAVARETFRGDLYYRLNGFSIELPALRNRGSDLKVLVDHLLLRFGSELGREVTGVAPEAMALLKRYPWPGNVRELQNVLRQALLLCTGGLVLPEHLPRVVRDQPAVTEAGAEAGVDGASWDGFLREGLKRDKPELYARALEQMERGLLSCVLRHTNGHQTRAAELLGITRGSLRHKLRALGIEAEQVADGERAEEQE
jgi:two-component system nitrogen regulation response regulator GlnG